MVRFFDFISGIALRAKENIKCTCKFTTDLWYDKSTRSTGKWEEKTMYRAMLVDDEIWVIRGLMKTIPWKELGFEVSFYTTDSELAKEKLPVLKPDIVISDIKMASVTGLDLLAYASTLNKVPEFLLISAYEEFEYAHQALKWGAFDYIIKPLKKTDMLHALERMKKALDEKKGNNIRNFTKEILDKHKDLSVGTVFEQYRQRQEGKMYLAACCSRSFVKPDVTTKFCEGSLQEHTVFLEDEHFLYGIICIPEDEGAAMLTELKRIASEYMTFVGVSTAFEKDDVIYPYIQQARSAALQFLLGESETLNFYREEQRLSKKDTIYATLRDAFATGNGDVILNIVKGLQEFIRKKQYTIQDMIGVGNYISINLAGQEDFFATTGIESITAFLDKFKTAEDYIQNLESAVKAAFPNLKGEKTSAEDVKDYVDRHYMEKILVCDIAEQFHMDINYISRLFKKKMGKSLKDYLTERRIERAKYLLANTDMKIYEISEVSGYSDYFYFTKVFRRWTGVTPSEFREG